ncbi:hypothetical protein F503_01480 [Ophiostoma piceae UAMH 11346]|uniref:Uncharacterized protein n=1 Tax=Ophiostoma piceae (strain UAMH 11346) TaxID=1262450 RepID=S3BPE5_OPHP1|nr:hypothetical protein F503_01480 [Ophiostoma piceae UAMH 11346]
MSDLDGQVGGSMDGTGLAWIARPFRWMDMMMALRAMTWNITELFVLAQRIVAHLLEPPAAATLWNMDPELSDMEEALKTIFSF